MTLGSYPGSQLCSFEDSPEEFVAAAYHRYKLVGNFLKLVRSSVANCGPLAAELDYPSLEANLPWILYWKKVPATVDFLDFLVLSSLQTVDGFRVDSSLGFHQGFQLD